MYKLTTFSALIILNLGLFAFGFSSAASADTTGPCWARDGDGNLHYGCTEDAETGDVTTPPKDNSSGPY
jgi:hypothetical protein